MHILVTGGAGFIGSHLVERLLADDHAVTVVDSFDTFYSPTVKRRNLKAVESHPRFRLLELDIRDAGRLEDSIESRVDAVVHLAARAGVRPSIEQPSLYCDVNVNGTLALLEYCRRQTISRFVFGSSSSVYGNDARAPFQESEAADRPISPYAATKRAGELLCYTYHHLHHICVASLRFFTVYGPRQRPDLAIHKFARRIMRGEPIHVFGDGSMRRDFTYVADIVDGICAALEWTGHQNAFELFNVGGSNPTTVLDLISLLEQALDRTAIVEFRPTQQGDVEQTIADLTKSKRVLGYEPRMTLTEGLSRFAAWLDAEDEALVEL